MVGWCQILSKYIVVDSVGPYYILGIWTTHSLHLLRPLVFEALEYFWRRKYSSFLKIQNCSIRFSLTKLSKYMKGIGEVRAHFFISEIRRLFYGLSKFAVLSTWKSHAKMTVKLPYQSPSIFMKCYSSLRITQCFIYIWFLMAKLFILNGEWFYSIPWHMKERGS